MFKAGWDDFENIALKNIRTICKQMTNVSSMHEIGHPKLVVWDNKKGQGVGREVRGIQGWGGNMGEPVIDVWQKQSQYFKVIILQKIIN